VIANDECYGICDLPLLKSKVFDCGLLGEPRVCYCIRGFSL